MASIRPPCIPSKMPFSIKYVFSIDGSATPKSVGQSPEGQRIDLQYEDLPGGITTDPSLFIEAWWTSLLPADQTRVRADFADIGITNPDPYQAIVTFRTLTAKAVAAKPPSQQDKYEAMVSALKTGTSYPLPWFGLAGDVVSGSDWILLRNDGVAELSGRFTLRSSDEDHALIDAVATGIVDWASPAVTPLRADTFSTAAMASGGTSRPLLVSATFDATGAAQSWAPSGLVAQASGFWKYQRLTQGQFIAVGTATLGQGKVDTITGVKLKVYELRPL
jgi:hypothetical protein